MLYRLQEIIICYFWLITVVYSHNYSTSPCLQRKWPSMELFIPVVLNEVVHRTSKSSMYDRKTSEFSDFFLKSYLLFWPEHADTTVRVLVDAERGNTTLFSSFRKSLTTMLPTIQYDFIPQSPWYNGEGGRRQQFSMFWADNWTTPGTEFVAFADSDAAFVTYVDREDLFEDGKPVINGRFGVEPRRPW